MTDKSAIGKHLLKQTFSSHRCAIYRNFYKILCHETLMVIFCFKSVYRLLSSSTSEISATGWSVPVLFTSIRGI